MQQALSAVSCYESAPTEQAKLDQLEDFMKTTQDGNKVMSGEVHRLASVSYERD